MAWTEIKDYTVPSNTTSVTLDDFGTITKDDFIKVFITVINGSSNTGAVRILANSSTSANYHFQELVGAGSDVTATRVNDSRINRFGSSDISNSLSYLKLSENDRLNVFSNYDFRAASPQLGFAYSTSSGATFPSGVTSLTFTADQTNGLGTGSRIQIYKLTAEKVVDLTVYSNTTQVDLTGFTMDKGSEYLLVSDALNATTSTIEPSLFVNDNNTTSNYYSQSLRGFSSTSYAERANNAAFTQLPRSNLSPVNNTGYTHIKLSNIGAYTYQSYNMVRGGNEIQVGNWFGSSTAENITSITKLSIVAPVANAIAAGSRFMLYKLY